MQTLKTEKVCRACLREDDQMIDMIEKDVYQKFLVFANLTDGEEIPAISLNLCQSCEEKLNMSLDFKDECQKSHEILLNYVKNSFEVALEPTDVDAKKPSRLEQFSQHEVSEAIEDLKQKFNGSKNCIRCSYVGNSRSLSLHISRVHKDLKPRWCCTCHGEFDNLTDHVASNHGDDYTCQFCAKKFQNISNLIKHLGSHSDVKWFQCSYCNKSYNRDSYLSVHLKKHEKEIDVEKQTFVATNCQEEVQKLLVHTRKHLCTVCKKHFRNAVKLKEHMQVHPSKCTYCDKTFKTHHNMVEHKRTHTGEKPYVCQVCEKKFAQSSTLQGHMMVHNVGQKISCNICSKKFSRANQLRLHVRTHTGEKPHVCTECEKAFIRSSDLVQHNKTHSSLRPYKCSYCDDTFKHSRSVKYHEWIHLGEKPYKCNQCSYAGRHSFSLTQHMQQHEVDQPRADRPHVCLMCNSTFTTDAMLKSHINKHYVSFLEI